MHCQDLKEEIQRPQEPQMLGLSILHLLSTEFHYLQHFLFSPIVGSNYQRSSCRTGIDTFDNSFSARNPSEEDDSSVTISVGLRRIKIVLVQQGRLNAVCKWVIIYDQQRNDCSFCSDRQSILVLHMDNPFI